jgi:quercetin dioxygenase-like cupin family protein
MTELLVRKFDDGEWADESTAGENPAEMMARAKESGYRRKRLLAGEGDVHLTYIEMGPGFTVDPHSHNAREVIHVLAGGLTPAGTADELTAGDSLVVPAGNVYGFTCGSEGVKFLIFRPSDAGISHVQGSA